MSQSQNRSELCGQDPESTQTRRHQRGQIPQQVPGPREHCQAVRRPPGRSTHLHHHGAAHGRRTLRPHSSTRTIHRTRGEHHHEIAHLRPSVHSLARSRASRPQAREHHLRRRVRSRQSEDRGLWLREAQTRPEANAEGGYGCGARVVNSGQVYAPDAVFHAAVRRARGPQTSPAHKCANSGT